MIDESKKLHNKPVADSPLTLAEVTGFMAMEVKLQSSLTEQNAKFIKVYYLFNHSSKELRHDILSHFFDGLNCGLSAGKPKNNGLLRKENTKGLILKKKGTRMAEDGQDSNGLEMTILKSLAIFFFFFFSKNTNDDVAPFNITQGQCQLVATSWH